MGHVNKFRNFLGPRRTFAGNAAWYFVRCHRDVYKRQGVKMAQLLNDKDRLALLGQRAAVLGKPLAARAVIDQIEARLL